MSAPNQANELALFGGGPADRILLALQPHGAGTLPSAMWRIAALVAFTWLPLLLLAAWEAQASAGVNRMPFLMDASVHVRLLLALPLLVLAEVVVDARIRGVPDTFVQRGLVPPDGLAKLQSAIDQAHRQCHSMLAEGLMLVAVLALAVWQLRGGQVGFEGSLADGVSWHVLPTGHGHERSLAGLWFALVSLPLFQFLTLRWYYRILVWARLMWRISRLPLQLLPGHPDRLAGLGFLASTVSAYVPLALAHGSMLSGAIVNRIVYGGAVLTDFRVEMVIMVLFVFAMLLLPLLVFTPVLMALHLKATSEFGALATGVARAFEQRWVRDGSRQEGDLLEVGEVSAMTDLDATVGIVREMRFIPYSRSSLLAIGAAVLAPLAPLLLTLMPADELIQRLVGIFV